MTQTSNETPVLISMLIGLLPAAGIIVVMAAVIRKRRWHDWKPLARAAVLPPELVVPDPKTVRDLAVGQESWVDRWAIATSKRSRRVFVGWDASLTEPPSNANSTFSPLRIRRLKRGFALTIKPGDQFRISPLPWGLYAPVIELLQATPSDESSHRTA